MNNPEFQNSLFLLEKNEQLALLKTLKKIGQLSWSELYADTGLKWEAIISKTTKVTIAFTRLDFHKNIEH